VVAGGAFYGGMAYAQSSRSAQANVFQGGNGSQQGGRRAGGAGGQGGFGGGAGARGGNFINGQVIAKDDKSITIQLRNGGTQFVFFSPTTPIMKLATGTADDLQKGTNVMVSGTATSDGSVTAQMIQVRPEGMNFGGFGGVTQERVPMSS